MLNNAMTLIRNELRNYFQADIGLSTVPDIELGNIGLLETENGDNLGNRIILTLVNIEEESTLKNLPNFKKDLPRIDYIEPPVFLNLYLLFSCNFDLYETALIHLSSVIRFFQSRKKLNGANSTAVDLGDLSPQNPGLLDLQLAFELYTLTFEQINHLWGALGGKQIPSVMYKVRLVSISERDVLREAPLIDEVQSQKNATN